MTTFLIVAGLLLAGALLFVVPPLLRGRGATSGVSHDGANISVYQDQLAELGADLAAGNITEEQHCIAREEIERRVLGETGSQAAARADLRARWLAPALGVAIPLTAATLYFVLGNPDGLDPKRVTADAGGGPGHAVEAQQIRQMVDKLAARLRENPENAEGWALLGRSMGVLGRFAESADAYRQAVKRAPDNAELLADFADALGMAQGRQLQGEPEAVIRKALKADPKNVKALALAGSAAFERKDYGGAAAQWEKILPLAAPDSPIAANIRGSIAEARQLAGLPAAPEPAPVAVAAGVVSGKVSLSPGLAKQASPDDTVFIFARAATGPRMPLAIQRKTVRDLPVEFRLDDSMAMAPGMTISSVPRVVVGARVSKRGGAMPQKGDLEGISAPVAPGATVGIVIDTVVN